MLDSELIKWLSGLGVGGILAAFTLTIYRKDIKQYTELWRSTAEMLVNTIKENTASNIKLIALIETQERNSLRKQDIIDLVHSELKK